MYKFCENSINKLKDNWKNDRRAGRIRSELDEEHLDKKGSIKWLKKGTLQYDGDRLMVVAHDQALTTRATLNVLYPDTVP